MAGEMGTGKEHVQKIKDQRINLVITIGWPATQIAAEHHANATVFHAFANRNSVAKLQQNNQLNFRLNTNVPLTQQIEVIRRLFPGTKSIGFIYNPDLNADRATAFKTATERLSVQAILEPIASPKQLPSALRRIINSSDAILFVRDAKVLNRDSAEYVINTTLENRVPAFGYSEALVRLGMLGAIVPNYFLLGKRFGYSVSRHISETSNGTVVALNTKDVEVFVNSRSAKQFQNLINNPSLSIGINWR